MSRAIFKIRGSSNTVILFTDTQTSSTPGSSVTFSNVNVGGGGNRTIIVGVTVERTGNDNGASTTITVGGINCPQRLQLDQNLSGDSIHSAIYSVALTSQTGNVDIVIQGALAPQSWGMSAVILRNLSSPVPTDTATKRAEGSSSLTTTSTLEGTAGGFVVGLSNFDLESRVQTWGNLMTKRSGVSTGNGAQDHRHSAAYDLIPAGRSAATETVSTNTTAKYILLTAAFR